MKPVKQIITIQYDALVADFAITGKTIADAYATENPNYDIKAYNFMLTEKKVYITYSKNNQFYVEAMNKWPLGRRQREVVKSYDIDWDNTDDAATLQDAINIATTVADNLTFEGEYIYTVKLHDRINHSRTLTVLPSMFANSTYVARIASVVVGDSTAGKQQLPALWDDEFQGDGIAI